MTKLIIGNQLTEETAEDDNALPEAYKQILGRVAHRMIWLAGPDDVIVLPTPADKDFAEQVWRSLEIGDRAPSIVVPARGRLGTDLLYDDRYTDPAALATLKELVTVKGVDRVLPFYFDESVVRLARAVGIGTATPGFQFLAEGGNEIVNTKSFFRVLAAGVGVTIPVGCALTDRDRAEELAWSLLAEGKSVILKQDVHGGGFGNEIFTTDPGLPGIGANETLVFSGRPAMADYLASAWHRYTQRGRRGVVVEHYLHDTIPIYIEIDITDDGVAVVGYGEMRMKPTNNGLVVPAPSDKLPSFRGFREGAGRIGHAVRVMGYRGRMSIDAMVTADEEIVFNEMNGRVGGSTHIHLIGERIIGPRYLDERVLVARNRCTWPSVAEALRALADHHLRYDPASRTGVLISGDDGQCLMIGETLEHALALEEGLVKALGLEDD